MIYKVCIHYFVTNLFLQAAEEQANEWEFKYQSSQAEIEQVILKTNLHEKQDY